MTARRVREQLTPLLPAAIDALRAALATEGERVPAARVILERLLPARAALALAAETSPEGSARIVFRLVPGADDAPDD